MPITPRYYQRESVDAVYDFWRNGGGNPLVTLATGCGKSLVHAMICKELIEYNPETRILSLVHSRELVRQNSKELMLLWNNAPMGIYCSGLKRRDVGRQILVGSIQSLCKKGEVIGKRDLILVDEAHLIGKSGDGMYRRLFEELRSFVPDLRICGLTATDYRLDSGRLTEGEGRIFDEVVYNYDIARGVSDGYLAPLIAPKMETEIDLTNVRRMAGEFNASDLEEAAGDEKIVEAACDELVSYGHDRKSWLVFCSGVKHAFKVRDALRKRGISCDAASGETPTGERDMIVKKFDEGRTRALTNDSIFTTGFNVKRIDMVVFLTSTMSTGRYVQIVGRGTRPVYPPGFNQDTATKEERLDAIATSSKPNCLICDFGGNVRRHGPVDSVNVTTKKKGQKSEKTPEIKAKICPGCTVYNASSSLECPNCGFKWELPAPRHGVVADTQSPIMTTEIVNKWIDVDNVRFYRHQKDLERPPTMRVDYVCGIAEYSEWISFESDKMMAKSKAAAWWRAFGGETPYPKSVDEAMQRAGELVMAKSIIIIKQDKWWRVVRWRVERDGVIFEVDANLNVRMMEIA